MCYEIAGTIAAVLSTFQLIPQVIKTYQSGEAKDLALAMILCFFLAGICWVLYGIGIQSKPLIITNSFQIVFALMLLTMKLRSQDRLFS